MNYDQWPIDVATFSTPHVLEDDRYLARLSRRLYRDGYTTIGKVSELGASKLRERFGASPSVISRVRAQLNRFDLDLEA